MANSRHTEQKKEITNAAADLQRDSERDPLVSIHGHTDVAAGM